jgi:CubicO group peptidase (beta-lactamase class C family)
VPELLPDIQFKGAADGLTIWHLLTHTGGIGEAPNPEDLARPFDKLFADEPKQTPLAEAYENGITLEVPPATKWAYANHGYMLLGEIISRIEGADIQDVLHRRIFEPLGMKDSDIRDEPHDGLSTAITARRMRTRPNSCAASDRSRPKRNLLTASTSGASTSTSGTARRVLYNRRSRTWRAMHRPSCGEAAASCSRKRSGRWCPISGGRTNGCRAGVGFAVRKHCGTRASRTGIGFRRLEQLFCGVPGR